MDGFNTPIVDWIKGEWKQYLLDLINSTDFKQSNVVNPKEVSEKIIIMIIFSIQSFNTLRPVFDYISSKKNHNFSTESRYNPMA